MKRYIRRSIASRIRPRANRRLYCYKRGGLYKLSGVIDKIFDQYKYKGIDIICESLEKEYSDYGLGATYNSAKDELYTFITLPDGDEIEVWSVDGVRSALLRFFRENRIKFVEDTIKEMGYSGFREFFRDNRLDYDEADIEDFVEDLNDDAVDLGLAETKAFWDTFHDVIIESIKDFGMRLLPYEFDDILDKTAEEFGLD